MPRRETDKQGYVAAELTHFVGRVERSNDRRFDLLCNILKEGVLKTPDDPGPPWEAGITMAGGNICEGGVYHRLVVCFCDIPVHELYIHTGKYGSFGLAFPKAWLVQRGASPVFYVASNSGIVHPGGGKSRGQAFNERAAQHQDLWLKNVMNRRNTGAPEWVRDYLDQLETVQHFQSSNMFAYVKCFDASLPDDHRDNFYMEREWRVVGRIEFDRADLSHAVVPLKYQGRLENEFPDLTGRIVSLARHYWGRRLAVSKRVRLEPK